MNAASRPSELRAVVALAMALAAVPSGACAAPPPDACAAREVIGNSMPGDWRPFSAASPWNTPIPADATLHPDSESIVATLAGEAANLRLANAYTPPLWVVDSRSMPHYPARCAYPFDAWDPDYDGVTETPVPYVSGMYGEPTRDGHIIVLDPILGLAWEMSRFTGLADGVVGCSTFNVWDLEGSGVGDPNEGRRWGARGGRGSGFPVVAGLIRPEEVAAGEIQHALVFVFSANRAGAFLPPAARNDGRLAGNRYPVEGMRVQLDPGLGDADFDAWGLTREARVVARALQTYGMYDGDNGGAMSLQLQLLGPSARENRAVWDARFPGFYATVRNIPTGALRVVDTGTPVEGGAQSTVVQPQVLPLGGDIASAGSVTLSTPTPDAHIVYTLDGSEPTPDSTPYGGPFVLEGAATVQARAFKPGMSPSPVTRAAFTDCSAATREPSGSPAPMD